jgi:hypothetical protein
MRRTYAGAVLVGLLVCTGANVLLYTARSTSPLIGADDWVFVDWIVRKAAAGQLVLGDLFLKRSAFDHSQPLRKLILLFHWRYFDLDFSIAAFIGVLAAFVNVGIFWLIVKCSGERGVRQRPLVLAAFAAMVAVYLSLNAPVVYDWSLLTLGFTSHVFLLVFLAVAWLAYRNPRAWPIAMLVGAAFAMDLVADDVGLITTIAGVLALALVGARQRRLAASLRTAVAMVGTYAGYALFRWSITFGYVRAPGNGLEGILAGRLGRLLHHTGAVFGGLDASLIASVAHRSQLHWLLGNAAAATGVCIAVVLVACHAWFWWRAWCGRHDLAAFVAIGLMLLFYGLLAGTLLARVSVYGIGYLWQPRYVLMYAWNIIALLLMAISQLQGTDSGDAPEARVSPALSMVGRSALGLAVAALLALQVPMSYHSWTAVKYRSTNIQRRAAQLGAMAADRSPDVCASGKPGCIDHHRQVARFLKRNRLSVFSPSFRARNRVYPDAQSLPH